MKKIVLILGLFVTGFVLQSFTANTDNKTEIHCLGEGSCVIDLGDIIITSTGSASVIKK